MSISRDMKLRYKIGEIEERVEFIDKAIKETKSDMQVIRFQIQDKGVKERAIELLENTINAHERTKKRLEQEIKDLKWLLQKEID